MGLTGAFMVPHPPLIIPEVGRGEEKKIAKTVEAYEEVGRRIAALKPETVIVVSPHSVMYADYIHISPGAYAEGNFGDFRAPGVRIRADYDSGLRDLIVKEAEKAGISAGTAGDRNARAALDHATMIPLWFLNHYDTEYRLIRIGISGLPFRTHFELGKLIARCTEELGRRTVFVASGDLSHYLKEDGPYGYRSDGPRYDREITEIMETGAFERLLALDPSFCDRAGECGQRGFCMLAGTLYGKAFQSELLSYEGPFGVGYGVCACTML